LDVVFLRQARLEATAAAVAYADRDRRTVEAFLDRLDEAVQQLSAFPRSGRRASHGAHLLYLAPYPYVLVYVVSERHVTVVAITHGRQRPDYWRSRLQEGG
jgi:plasmid stabilization system protein ParE